MNDDAKATRLRREDIEAALTRAAVNARRLAAAAGQSVIYCRDGQIVEEYPRDERTPPAVREAG